MASIPLALPPTWLYMRSLQRWNGMAVPSAWTACRSSVRFMHDRPVPMLLSLVFLNEKRPLVSPWT